MAKSTRTRFTVSPQPGRRHATFPVDMLRYDACWPATGLDVDTAFGRIASDVVQVSLLTDAVNRPTVDRWASFGWRVTSTEAVR